MKKIYFYRQKMKFNKDFPFSIKFYCSWRHWHLFPIGETSRGTIHRLSYDSQRSNKSKNDVYHQHTYWLIHNYMVYFLFLRIIFKIKLIPASDEYFEIVRYREPLDEPDFKRIPINKN